MRRILILLCASVLVFTGCEKDSAKSSALANVKILEAGKGQKQPLRLIFEQGATRKLTGTFDMTMHMNGNTMPVPTMTMSFVVEILKVRSDASAETSLEVTDVNASGANASLVRNQVKSLIGTKWTMTITDRGQILEESSSFPDDIDPMMKQQMQSVNQSLQQLVVPFPQEPVAVGSRWTLSDRQVEVNGIKLNQAATFELVSVDKDTATIKSTVDQTAPKQTMKPPGSPVEVELIKMTSKGRGDLVVDLKTSVPVADMSVTSDMTMKAAGQTIDMTMSIDMKMAYHK